MAFSGSPGDRAKAYQRVALEGVVEERARAAFVWGLLACEARAPLSAVTAFRLAEPEGGLARLAARRLEEALATAEAPLGQWAAAARSGWLVDGDRARLVIRGAETLLEIGDAGGALGLLSGHAAVRERELLRWLRLQVLTDGPEAEEALRHLALEYPHRWGRMLPDRDLAAVTAEFSEADWQRHAVAWLGANQPSQAMRAAARAGGERPLLTARALNRLRRPRQALHWAQQVDVGRVEGWLERGEALRQMAWGASPAERPRRWVEVARAAERAFLAADPGSPERARAALLLGEALAERGRGETAAEYLTAPGVPGLPRWEWVWRRLIYLEASSGNPAAAPGDVERRSTRGRRLEQFWLARQVAPADGGRGLRELADSGFPDLPALWSAAMLGRDGVVFRPGDEAPLVPPPPPALADLLALGRVADALVAWRADLEAGLLPPQGWLGFVSMAGLSPPQAIPLLIQAEPRLLSGPWEGIPRGLLEQYLPLPFREELEGAAAEAGVPPWVLAGLVRQESGWNPRAVSPAGAVGLAQLMPATARDLVRRRRLPAQMGRALTDPEGNLRIGALLLREWQQRLGGSLPVALAAYNGGERRARLFWNRASRIDGPEFVEGIEVPETWDYVHRVALLAEGYRTLYWPEGKGYPWR